MRFEDAVSESTVFVVSERQSVLNVLDLSSGMHRGVQTTVFVVFGDAVTLKVLVLSIENSWPCASLKPLYL